MIIFRPIHVATNDAVPFFLMDEYTPHRLYPFICPWTFMLCPFLGYCKQCCDENNCMYLLNQNFSWNMPRIGITGSVRKVYFSFLRKYHTIFHSDCTNLHSHQHLGGFSFFSTPSQIFVICVLFNNGHSDQYEEVHHCNFDLCL